MERIYAVYFTPQKHLSVLFYYGGSTGMWLRIQA